jgi:hypothetical protein
MYALLSPGSPPAARERIRRTTNWLIQVLLGTQVALLGLDRLTGLPRELGDRLGRIGTALWFRYAEGTLDTAGAIGLVVPGLVAVLVLGLFGLLVAASGAQLVGLIAWTHGPIGRPAVR